MTQQHFFMSKNRNLLLLLHINNWTLPMFAPLTEHIEIDRTQRRIRKDGTEVHLTGFEYGLLEYLVSHANRICTRNEVLD